MGKAAFALGVVGSLVAGLLLSSRLEHRDYSGSIVNKTSTCSASFVGESENVPHGPSNGSAFARVRLKTTKE